MDLDRCCHHRLGSYYYLVIISSVYRPAFLGPDHAFPRLRRPHHRCRHLLPDRPHPRRCAWRVPKCRSRPVATAGKTSRWRYRATT